MPDEQLLHNLSQLSITTDQKVTVQAVPEAITGNQIPVRYSTPNANQPNQYSNNLYIWQSGNAIPWSSQALNSVAIASNTPTGAQSFDQLNVTDNSYIIGYAVGPKTTNTGWSDYANVVAATFVPATKAGQTPNVINSVSSVDLQYQSINTLVAKIDMLNGYRPADSGTYVGVWEGNAASYTVLPKWRSPALQNNASSTVSFNNIALLRGTTYTLGLFATGYSDQDQQLKQTALTATHTFTV